MSELQAKTLGAPITTIGPDELNVLESAFRGRLVRREDEDYDAARSVYNAMIDRRPALVAEATDVADVIAAVKFARERDLLLAVRGAGHSGPGLGTVDDGLVLDLGGLKGIRVDPSQRTVRVGAGHSWGDVDHATHPFGLAVPAGIISSTGVGGLTLGGGHGYLSRKYGLTIGNLLSADMVLADGSFVAASAVENADLFWAIRGGGGNFGVVTSFQFQAHRVSTVFAGPIFWPMDDAAEVIEHYDRYIRQAPEEMYAFFAFLQVPPAPPFPEELHLRKVAAIIVCHLGTDERASEQVKALASVGTPLMVAPHRMPFPVWNSMFDPVYPPGLQWYWKGDFANELSDEAVNLHVQHGSRLPTWQSTMHIYPIDGAVHRVGHADTPWGYRDVMYSTVTAGVDPDPANKELITTWAREYWEALHPHSAGGAYVNFMMDEGQERVQATYRQNYARLAALKARFDPSNLFRVNQNIRPES